MSTGARRERVVVTHVAGRIGDHNDRAMAASPRLAAALALGIARLPLARWKWARGMPPALLPR